MAAQWYHQNSPIHGNGSDRTEIYSVDSTSVELTSVPKFVKSSPLRSNFLGFRKDTASRGKAGVFLKDIVCAQIGWLLVQCIARRAQSLATSSLEGPMSFVHCFPIPHEWKKPYDLESPTTVTVSPEYEVVSLLEDGPLSIPMNDIPDLPPL